MNFTTKERTLLEDQKNHEKICIEKYSNYESLAQEQQLKSLFNQLCQAEKQHYNTIDQLLKGQMPQMQQSSSGSQQGTQQQGQQQNQQQGQKQNSMQMKSQQMPQVQGMQAQSGGSQMQAQQAQQAQQATSFIPKNQSSNYSTSDKDLCTDMLMTEKYVSGAYNSAIFEFRDPQVRSILNHIQKEEQQHGESIFKYMESNGMYQAQ
ncbi:MAG TPA: spore coat protein [Clostridiales bacterium]|nr:spore coat protein [Clostridiales bacterium]